MKNLTTVQAVGLSVMILMGLGAALLYFFQDLPLLWTITLLVIALAVGITGYVLGYLFEQRKD